MKLFGPTDNPVQRFRVVAVIAWAFAIVACGALAYATHREVDEALASMRYWHDTAGRLTTEHCGPYAELASCPHSSTAVDNLRNAGAWVDQARSRASLYRNAALTIALVLPFLAGLTQWVLRGRVI